jgi:hypothetical protein
MWYKKSNGDFLNLDNCVRISKVGVNITFDFVNSVREVDAFTNINYSTMAMLKLQENLNIGLDYDPSRL